MRYRRKRSFRGRKRRNKRRIRKYQPSRGGIRL